MNTINKQITFPVMWKEGWSIHVYEEDTSIHIDV